MKKYKWILLVVIIVLGVVGFVIYKEVNKPKDVFEEIYKVEVKDSQTDTENGLKKIGYREFDTVNSIKEKGTFGLEKKFSKTKRIDYIFITLPGGSLLDDPSVLIIYETRLSDKENIVYDYLYDIESNTLTKRIDYNMDKKNLSKYGLTEKEVEVDYKKVLEEKVIKIWVNTYKDSQFTESNIGNINVNKGKIYK
ncbi:hypothetical protein RD055328_03860 [Companilactobacillus sp. RD055328]|uniref:TipC family immunity protein n=1 Tax=Companilactobacillus sp. RD055328 TaxID=2916634 RepID=UPI001FC877AD|nr:TipC family immunity protein [Companilactobacillus sp. RD055328]GKQ42463.1 hypothetical protein RD055328_03860 [Companilactobacillus sp. RD055328]